MIRHIDLWSMLMGALIGAAVGLWSRLNWRSARQQRVKLDAGYNPGPPADYLPPRLDVLQMDYSAKCKRLRQGGPTPCLMCPGECEG